MGAITDLWKSERGLIAVLLIITAGVLAAIGHMSVQEWTEFAKWIFVTYAAAKTITGVTQIAKGGTADPEKTATQANQPTPVPNPSPVGQV